MDEKEKQALLTSLRLLAATPKSTVVLRQKLERRGYDSTVIQKTLDYLRTQGVLDDRVYAQSVMQSLTHRRISGRKRIAFELGKRGIAEPLVRDLLEAYPREVERERALQIALEKYHQWKAFDRLKRQKKIYDFLARRGFDFELCRDVLSQLGKTENLP